MKMTRRKKNEEEKKKRSGKKKSETFCETFGIRYFNTLNLTQTRMLKITLLSCYTEQSFQDKVKCVQKVRCTERKQRKDPSISFQ